MRLWCRYLSAVWIPVYLLHLAETVLLWLLSVEWGTCKSHTISSLQLFWRLSNLKSWESFRLSGSISSSRIYKQCQIWPGNFLSTSLNSYPPTAGGKLAFLETQGLEHAWSQPGKKPELYWMRSKLTGTTDHELEITIVPIWRDSMLLFHVN